MLEIYLISYPAPLVPNFSMWMLLHESYSYTVYDPPPIDYYDISDGVDPVTPIRVETLGQVESTSASSRFEQTPTTRTVHEFSIANSINLRGKLNNVLYTYNECYMLNGI